MMGLLVLTFTIYLILVFKVPLSNQCFFHLPWSSESSSWREVPRGNTVTAVLMALKAVPHGIVVLMIMRKDYLC
jgi:hypothetical protein